MVTDTEKKKSGSIDTGKKPPLFRRMNYILIGLGILFLVLGYILLSGGGAASDAEFSEAIFDTRRMVIAPTLILLGLVIEIVAIMYYPRAKKTSSKE